MKFTTFTEFAVKKRLLQPYFFYAILIVSLETNIMYAVASPFISRHQRNSCINILFRTLALMFWEE